MKIITDIFIALSFTLCLLGCQVDQPSTTETISDMDQKVEVQPDSLLRHMVLFKYREDADSTDIQAAEAAFVSLEQKIPQIQDFEWGINNSPEGLNKGLTHCYFLTFYSEEDRDIYLPHPDHQAFVEMMSDIVVDVIVLDYWTR